LPSDIRKELATIKNTEVAYGIENTIKMAIRFLSIVKSKLDICLAYKCPAIFVENETIWKTYNCTKTRGASIHFITEITKDNIFYCKKLSEIGQVKHLEGLNSNFAVADDLNYAAPTISQEYAPTVPMMIRISIKDFVDQHQYFFNILWNKAIPAKSRILELEQGIKPDIIETIRSPLKIQNNYLKILESTKDEIMLIIPTIHILKLQNKMGVIQLLKDLVTGNKNLQIRILTPLDKNSDENISDIENVVSLSNPSPYIQIRNFEEMNSTIR
jgi:two-component system, OmpR family, sensor histidine kinase VicK